MFMYVLFCLCTLLSYMHFHVHIISAEVAWTYNGGHLPENSDQLTPEPGVAVLHLNAVQKENTGKYACLAYLGMYTDAVALELDVYGEGCTDTVLRTLPHAC